MNENENPQEQREHQHLYRREDVINFCHTFGIELTPEEEQNLSYAQIISLGDLMTQVKEDMLRSIRGEQ